MTKVRKLVEKSFYKEVKSEQLTLVNIPIVKSSYVKVIDNVSEKITDTTNIVIERSLWRRVWLVVVVAECDTHQKIGVLNEFLSSG